MQEVIGVIQIGMGPIGQMITRQLVGRRRLQLRGAVDINPERVGKDVGRLAGLEQEVGVRVTAEADEVLKDPQASVVLHTTGSDLRSVSSQLERIVRAGKCVVSTTEELAYPSYAHPEIGAMLDSLAKENKVAIVATGVNPGFAMDLLPLTLSSVVTDLKHIHVQRYQDASVRRLPFRKKIGVGMNVDEFTSRVKQGGGHVGMGESIALIASTVGWQLDGIADTIEPIIAERSVAKPDIRVDAGQVAGCRMLGRGFANGHEVILLEMLMSVEATESFDRVVIEGSRRVESIVKGGIHGDVATVARVLNTVPIIVKMNSGLYTVTELPTVSATVL